MTPLKPEHRLCLLAAEGWLELGNAQEALQELENIPAKLQSHPDVLELRWQICAHKKTWEECLPLARSLIQQAPERASGWIDLSFALHELKRTQEAWDNLFAVADKFADTPTVAYNLACYGAQLGRLWEAEQWFKQALKMSNDTKLTAMALADPDLKPIWEKIKQF